MTLQGRRAWHGSAAHNGVLLEPLEERCHSLGARTTREALTGSGRTAGRVDLLVETGVVRLVIEAELSSKRVLGDLAKATTLAVDGLLIVVPTSRVARSVVKRLQNHDSSDPLPRVFVLPLGQALQRLSAILDLMTWAVSHGSSSPETSLGEVQLQRCQG